MRVHYLAKKQGKHTKGSANFQLVTYAFDTDKHFETISPEYCNYISAILNSIHSSGLLLKDVIYLNKPCPFSYESIFIELYTKPFNVFAKTLIGWGIANSVLTQEEINSSIPNYSGGAILKTFNLGEKQPYQKKNYNPTKSSQPSRFTKEAITQKTEEKKVSSILFKAITQVIIQEESELSEMLWNKLLEITKLEPKDLLVELQLLSEKEEVLI